MRMQRNWKRYAMVLDLHLGGVKQTEIAKMLRVSKQCVNLSARAHFRLILMPCCGQMLCWVNPQATGGTLVCGI